MVQSIWAVLSYTRKSKNETPFIGQIDQLFHIRKRSWGQELHCPAVTWAGDVRKCMETNKKWLFFFFLNWDGHSIQLDCKMMCGHVWFIPSHGLLPVAAEVWFRFYTRMPCTVCWAWGGFQMLLWVDELSVMVLVRNKFSSSKNTLHLWKTSFPLLFCSNICDASLGLAVICPVRMAAKS